MIHIHVGCIRKPASIQLSRHEIRVIVSYKIITAQIFIIKKQSYRLGVTGRNTSKLICTHCYTVIQTAVLLPPFQHIFLAVNFQGKRLLGLKPGGEPPYFYICITMPLTFIQCAGGIRICGNRTVEPLHLILSKEYLNLLNAIGIGVIILGGDFATGRQA